MDENTAGQGEGARSETGERRESSAANCCCRAPRGTLRKMTPDEVVMSNAEKLSELQGDALEVAHAVLAKWPHLRITSAARDYKDQARAMAQNACARRDDPKTPRDDRYAWIKDTYWPSMAALALQAWFEQHPHASEPDVVAGFTHLMSGMQPDELRALSKHVVIREREEGDGTGGVSIGDRACAFDMEIPRADATPEQLEIDRQLCEFLLDQAHMRRGKFFMKEGGLARRHWQAA